MSFMEKLERNLDGAALRGIEHPLRDAETVIRDGYFNALAIVIAGAATPELNHQYVATLCVELNVQKDFSALLAEYQRAPESVDINAITAIFQEEWHFPLLLLDAAMIAPNLYAELQTDVWTLVPRLHALLKPQVTTQDWYPAIFRFAAALANATQAPDFLFDTTGKYTIPACWNHLLRFKRLLSETAQALPGLCRCIPPGKVGEIFRSGNFTTNAEGELLLSKILLRNQLDAAAFLLKKGADVNAMDQHGNTVLDDLGYFISTEMLDLFLSHRAKVKPELLNLLLLMKNPDRIACLMRHHVEFPAETMMNFLAPLENVRTYLENGGTVDLSTDGISWIDTAILMDETEVAELLKEFGARPSPDAKSLEDIGAELLSDDTAPDNGSQLSPSKLMAAVQKIAAK